MIEHTPTTQRGRKMWLRRFNKKVTNVITLTFASQGTSYRKQRSVRAVSAPHS